MPRPLRRAPGALAAAALIASLPATAAAQTATWYLGTYSNDILVWDEATEEVVDRITVENFVPINLRANESKTRLYALDASMENVEVVDLETRDVLDRFTLSGNNVKVRVQDFAPSPDDSRAILFVKSYERLPDRYVVRGPFILEYDLGAKEVTDTVPFPDGEERENVSFRYSPDGETLYLFTDDVVALDADTFEEVDRWEISKPLEPGIGRASFGVVGGTYDEPGVSTSLYRMTDPAQNRRLMGVARVRLSEQEVDFFTVGDAAPVRSFTLAPGGRKAYALHSEVGEWEFWEFDLDEERVVRRVPFEGRPRMGLQVSADGEKLYIYVAGPTIDVYDARTFERLRTVTLDDDMIGALIIPGRSP